MQEEIKNVGWLYGLAIASSLGMVTFGFNNGVFNLIQDFVSQVLGLSGREKITFVSNVSSFIPLGGLVGALFSSAFLGRFGRRLSLMIADILGIIGTASILYGNIHSIYTGRLIVGFSIGLNSVIVPLFVREWSPNQIRGTLTSFPPVSIVLGLFFAFVLGFGVPEYNDQGVYTDQGNEWWRLTLGFGALFNVIRLFSFLFIFRKESPTYLYFKDQAELCEQTLASIYKVKTVKSKLNTLKLEREAFLKKGEDTFLDLLNPEFRRATIVGISLALIQQFNGINAVNYYSKVLMKGSPQSPFSQTTITILTNSITLVKLPTVLFSSFMVDKAGRRTLFLWGVAVMAVSESLLSYFSWNEMPIASICCLYVYLFGFGFSIGPVFWVYMAEILPEKGITVVLVTHWIGYFIVVKSLPYMVDYLAVGGTFAIYSIICLIGLIFIYLAVPETKGLSRPQIINLFSKKATKVVQAQN